MTSYCRVFKFLRPNADGKTWFDGFLEWNLRFQISPA